MNDNWIAEAVRMLVRDASSQKELTQFARAMATREAEYKGTTIVVDTEEVRGGWICFGEDRRMESLRRFGV